MALLALDIERHSGLLKMNKTSSRVDVDFHCKLVVFS